MPQKITVPLDVSRGDWLNDSTWEGQWLYQPWGTGYLENFETSEDFFLRPRTRFNEVLDTSMTATNGHNSRGWYDNFFEDGRRRFLYMQSESAPGSAPQSFRLWQATSGAGEPDGIDDITGWAAAGAAFNTADPWDDYFVDFASGNGVVVFTNPGFPSRQLRKWDGTTHSAIATSDIAGRFVLYHLNRFWTGGGEVDASYLRFSEIGDEDSWNTAENFIPVGEDDIALEYGVAFDGGLVLGNRAGLWWLGGKTFDSFTLQPISRRIGVAAGPSMCVTPHGVAFVSPEGRVYLWRGGGDPERLDEGRASTLTPQPLHGLSSIAYATSVYSAVYVDGELRVAAAFGNYIYVFDFVTGTWRTERVENADTQGGAASANRIWLLHVGAEGMFGYTPERGYDTPLRYRWLTQGRQVSGYNALAPDTHSVTSYYVDTGMLYPNGRNYRSALKNLKLHVIQHIADSSQGAGLDIDVYVDGDYAASTPSFTYHIAPFGDSGGEQNAAQIIDIPVGGCEGYGYRFVFRSETNGTEQDIYSIIYGEAEFVVGGKA